MALKDFIRYCAFWKYGYIKAFENLQKYKFEHIEILDIVLGISQ